MKNNYLKLKLTLLLQAVFVIALTILVGNVVVEYILDNSSNSIVRFLTSLHIQEERARHWYWRFLGNNKDFFLIVGFLVLFAIFFYIALTKMVCYLKQVEIGIENIASDSEKSIHMIPELKPIEDRLTIIKQTLKKREMEAIEAERKKNDMVVFLAHDLKTPLTSVVAYLNMLNDHPNMDEENREYYTKIALDKSLRLGELINEFFEITKLNLQNMELEAMELDLSMMLEQLADEAYGVLQEKNLSCLIDAEEDLYIHGDPDKLGRVFDNILRNAITYCYENTEIRVTARRIRDRIEIVFENQGATIPRDRLNAIFEKFYRLDSSRSSKTGGTGLGLAIAKEIVELHGGEIRAESKEERVRFIVNLPN